MKYLCLVYLDAEHWNACADASCDDYAHYMADTERRVPSECNFCPLERGPQ